MGKTKSSQKSKLKPVDQVGSAKMAPPIESLPLARRTRSKRQLPMEDSQNSNSTPVCKVAKKGRGGEC